MLPNIEKVNPKFRQITDLLFLSEKTDINLSNYKSLLKLNQKDHIEYLMSQFEKSSHIFWDNGEKIWSFRLNFLFSLKEKTITNRVSTFIEKRFNNLIKVKSSPNPKYDVELIQFIEYCKYRRSKKESLYSLQESFIILTPQTNLNKLVKMVNYLIPSLFKDINEFGNLILNRILHYPLNFKLLTLLKDYGYKLNIKPIIFDIIEIIFKSNEKHYNNSILYLINNDIIRNELKKSYNNSYKKEFLNFIESCDFWQLEDKWLKNIINMIDIAPETANDIAIIYINKLYNQYYTHKRANSDRIIRLIKKCPQISTKKVLAHLSFHGKMSDIKQLVSAFPELKKLSAFV